MHKLTDTDLGQFLAENPPLQRTDSPRKKTHAHPCD
jgi:hypothetical protein